MRTLPPPVVAPMTDVDIFTMASKPPPAFPVLAQSQDTPGILAKNNSPKIHKTAAETQLQALVGKLKTGYECLSSFSSKMYQHTMVKHDTVFGLQIQKASLYGVAAIGVLAGDWTFGKVGLYLGKLHDPSIAFASAVALAADYGFMGCLSWFVIGCAFVGIHETNKHIREHEELRQWRTEHPDEYQAISFDLKEIPKLIAK